MREDIVELRQECKSIPWLASSSVYQAYFTRLHFHTQLYISRNTIWQKRSASKITNGEISSEQDPKDENRRFISNRQ
jgi:hypothetical protein